MSTHTLLFDLSPRGSGLNVSFSERLKRIPKAVESASQFHSRGALETERSNGHPAELRIPRTPLSSLDPFVLSRRLV